MAAADGSAPQPAPRPTARVLPVNQRGEVLLLVIRAAGDLPGLMSPGGGIEPEETPREAAVRELREETGIVAAPGDLVGPIHHGVLEWTGRRGGVDATAAQFFTVAVDADVAISFDGHQPEERDFVVGHTWVDPAALDGDPRVHHPLLPYVARTAAAVMGSADHVVRRASARVLPVSPDGAVLLLEELDPAQPGERYWSSIGGGVDASADDAADDLRATAVRELHEEAGIVVAVDDLVGPVHRLVAPYSWGGVDRLGDSTYFAVPLGRDVAVSLDHLEPEEVGTVLGAAWWTPDALAAGVVCRPPSLPEIMRAAVTATHPGGDQ